MSEISKLKKSDLVTNSLQSEIKRDLKQVNSNYEHQVRISEKTFSSISHQIGATSLNLTVFGILFAIAALGLGVYITFIERKTILIREETRALLNQTISTKEEVVEINRLIQEDIYGLFLKIKREETIHILKRLLKVPEDVANLSNELLSRELEKDDFEILKRAYFKLKPKNELDTGLFDVLAPMDTYKLIFFQHFLDLAVKDEIIGPDLIEFYPDAISSAFENDIIKSTGDFIKAIIDKGIQNCSKEINSYILALSKSKYSVFKPVYEIIYNGLKNRADRFKFFELLNDDRDVRLGKSKFGQILKEKYIENLTESETIVIDLVDKIENDLKLEEQRKIEQEEKRKEEQEEKKKKAEEYRKKREEKRRKSNEPKKNSTQK